MARPVLDGELTGSPAVPQGSGGSVAAPPGALATEPAPTHRRAARPTRSRVQFALAGRDQDAAIRQLLRENPMAGDIVLSFEREPDYFRGANLPGHEDQTIVAFEGDRLVCMGRCSIQRRCVNGEPRRVGYLADLRLDTSARGRFDILRRGYQFFRGLHRADPPDICFTSIAADNHRSIRFLERGLAGMPQYAFLAEFVTLLIPVRSSARDGDLTRGKGGEISSSARLEDLLPLLNSHATQHQLASWFTAEELVSLNALGLGLNRFRSARDGNRTIACAALWDQRCFKQTVVRGYSRRLSRMRPWLNRWARWSGGSQLPPIGSPLALGLLSPLAVPVEERERLPQLIEAFFPMAAERGLEFIALGFAANDPRLDCVRRGFRCREFRTRLYSVGWNDSGVAPVIFDGRPFLPELAFL